MLRVVVIGLLVAPAILCAQQWQPEARVVDFEIIAGSRVYPNAPGGRVLIALARTTGTDRAHYAYYDLLTLTPNAVPVEHVPNKLIIRRLGSLGGVQGAYGTHDDGEFPINDFCHGIGTPDVACEDLSQRTRRVMWLTPLDVLGDFDADGHQDAMYGSVSITVDSVDPPNNGLCREIRWSIDVEGVSKRSVFRVYDSVMEAFGPVKTITSMGVGKSDIYVVRKFEDDLLLDRLNAEDLASQRDTIRNTTLQRLYVERSGKYLVPVQSDRFTVLMSADQEQGVVFTPDTAYISTLESWKASGLVPGMLGQHWTPGDEGTSETLPKLILYKAMLSTKRRVSPAGDSVCFTVTLFDRQDSISGSDDLAPVGTITSPWVKNDTGERVELKYAELFPLDPGGYGIVIGYTIKQAGTQERSVVEWYRTSSIPTSVTTDKPTDVTILSSDGGWQVTGLRVPVGTVLPVFSTLGSVVGAVVAMPAADGVYLEGAHLPAIGPLFTQVGGRAYRLR